MNGRQLLVQWVVGLVCVAMLALGAPRWLRRGVETIIPGAVAARQGVEAARRDSIALAARTIPVGNTPADSALAAKADTARATMAVPPDPQIEGSGNETEQGVARVIVLVGVPLALLWNTWRWWRRRRETAEA